jgi:two-component system, chemotaxis family, sensor kinase CheA
MSAKKNKAPSAKNTSTAIYVLAIEPDAKVQNAFRGYIEGTDFTPITVNNADEAKKFLENEAVNTVAILCTLKLPDTTAIELRKICVEAWRQVPFVIVNESFPKDFAGQFPEGETVPTLKKPYSKNDLTHLINDTCAIRIEEIKLEREAVWESLEKFGTMLEDMENLILTLEDQPQDNEALQRVFGILHTIKGGSSFFKNPLLSNFCHRCEDALEGVKNLSIPVSKQVITLLLQSKDTIWEIMHALEIGEDANMDLEQLCTIFVGFKTAVHGAAQAVDPQAAMKRDVYAKNPKSKTKDWLKVPRSHIEDFLRINGEMTITKNMIDKFIKLELSQKNRNKNMEHLAKLFEQFFKHQQDMQNKMMNLKKVALTETFLQVRRDVRNLSDELGKQVDVVVDGENVSVDDSLIETIKASLVHIIRNSIDHGFEKPEDRKAAGKNPKGTLKITAYEEEDRIIVEIQDDGKGIDHERLRKVIVDRGVYSEAEAAKMDKKQLVSMIFKSGVSTAKNVTSISGRGIGLDMVYNSILQIQGRIDTDTEVGKGTKFTLTLPLPKSVVIFKSLVVAHNKGTYAIPQEHISQVISTNEAELTQNSTVQNVSGQVMMRYRSGTLPLFDLQNILEGYPEREFKYSADSNVVIINGMHKAYGVVVNTILGIEDTVVKGLSHTGNVSTIYMGATIFGDGQVGLILNPQGVSKLLQL